MIRAKNIRCYLCWQLLSTIIFLLMPCSIFFVINLHVMMLLKNLCGHSGEKNKVLFLVVFVPLVLVLEPRLIPKFSQKYRSWILSSLTLSLLFLTFIGLE